MALQRQNPLPVGRYWVDVTEKDFSKFEEWLKRNTSVHVVTVEETPRKQVSPGEAGPIGYAEYWPATRWYLFDVKVPTAWEGPGFPSIAKGETTKDDTVDKPPPMTSGDALEDVMPKLPKLPEINLGPIILVAGLFGLAYLIKQVKS